MLTENDILKMRRRQVRYHLYRIRTHEEGGASHRAKAIKEFYENREGFTGWRGFARTWDVDEEGEHHKIVKRRFTEEQEWNNELAEIVGEPSWQPK